MMSGILDFQIRSQQKGSSGLFEFPLHASFRMLTVFNGNSSKGKVCFLLLASDGTTKVGLRLIYR